MASVLLVFDIGLGIGSNFVGMVTEESCTGLDRPLSHESAGILRMAVVWQGMLLVLLILILALEWFSD